MEMEKVENKETSGAIDQFRIIAALLVIAIHTSPLVSYSETADFILTRIIARVAVPFFLMTTGYYLLPSCLNGTIKEPGGVFTAIQKPILLYGAATLFYLPFSIYAGYYTWDKGLPLTMFRRIVFDGTFYHLWYLPGMVLGVAIVSALGRYTSPNMVLGVVILLYLIGLCGDSYYGLTQFAPPLRAAYQCGFQAFSYTRNGLFYAPIFLVLGARIPQAPNATPAYRNGVGLLLSTVLLLLEGLALHRFGLQRHDSMYVMLPFCMAFLFRFLLSLPMGANKRLRLAALLIYLLHPAVIILVRSLAKTLGMESPFIGNSLCHYLTVSALSCLAAALTAWVWKRCTMRRKSTGRAWIELDRAALRNNVQILREALGGGCRLMPVVKANAYGHGAVLIARELKRLGARCLCVACVSEAVALRRRGIRGDILILGYTHPDDFFLLHKHRLTQTVLDLDYAKLLQDYEKPVKAHIKVDTGMHRLGVCCENLGDIVSILRQSKVKVNGVFTHLCADNSDRPADLEYTNCQITAFRHILDKLRDMGWSFRHIHMQSSYGVLRKGRPVGNGARVGIALYGLLGTPADTERYAASLRPVLSLKARVAAVKRLHAGEHAGYGLHFTAAVETTVAVLSIGYADGVSRSLSCGQGNILLHGKRAPIIGMVCMDQTLVDVSHIPEAQCGDIATLIGRDGDETITACEVAQQANTISNEVLARLGSRLERIWGEAKRGQAR